jgi:hypothetical protein
MVQAASIVLPITARVDAIGLNGDVYDLEMNANEHILPQLIEGCLSKDNG